MITFKSTKYYGCELVEVGDYFMIIHGRTWDPPMLYQSREDAMKMVNRIERDTLLKEEGEYI